MPDDQFTSRGLIARACGLALSAELTPVNHFPPHHAAAIAASVTSEAWAAVVEFGDEQGAWLLIQSSPSGWNTTIYTTADMVDVFKHHPALRGAALVNLCAVVARVLLADVATETPGDGHA